MKVYLHPNPSEENTSLIVFQEEEGLNYIIYSFNGKLVEKGKLTAHETKLNTKAFSEGIYFIHVFKNNDLKEVFKFLKQ